MTYEEQLDDAIKQLQKKLEEAFDEYDHAVNIYGKCGFNELNRIPMYVLNSLIDKWAPLTIHIRNRRVVEDTTIRLEIFDKLVEDVKLKHLFIPLIARCATL